ncbi:hypothetical protein A1O7_00236 [Cladophialophora yegresii CBS 114405]|uniref:Clr5 domain-containing protein n=1 Tax=Cladophialophora yegresii CBS 114405 TaxID=1182544 RepID=W9WH36_9EURO|nr:uncharacterized protein A1O7_00236 [Cladophialophora yegresii CBS 114405]EXJ63901.1 hypothetical protein A1O7_00236 [Cladophialophora yegresii CBS 114405]
MPPLEPSRTNTISQATRRRGPSPEEWDRVKPLIKRYYIVEKRRLKDVRLLLLDEHGFDAAIHKLKTKITEWGFKKNFKRQELEVAANEANRRSEHGMTLPFDIQIDGRPCDWDRVNRHYGRVHKDSRLRDTSSWHAFLPRVALKTTPTDYNLELSLKEVKSYWAVVIAKDESRASVRARRNASLTRHDPHNIEIGFFGGLNLIDQGHAKQGWQEINEMCEAVTDVIKMQEPSLLLSIISLFSASLWVDHHDLFILVAKYVLAACDMLLMRSHPITTVLTTLISLPPTAAVVDDFAEIAYQVMVDTVTEHGDQVKLDRYYTYCAEEYLISKIKSRLERHEAYELVSTKLAHYKRTLGPRSRHTISMRAQLAKMHLNDARKAQPETRERKEAENKGMEILHEIVKQGENYPNDRYRIGTYSIAAGDLARFYFGKQDFRNAQVYYCKAVLWGAEKFGRMHSHVSLVLREFRALQRMAELDIDIEVETAYKPVPNAAEDRSQESHSRTVDNGIGDVQGGNLGNPSFEESCLEAETLLEGGLFTTPTIQCEQTLNNGMIVSDLFDRPLDVLDQGSLSRMVPGQLLDDHPGVISDSQSPVLEITQDDAVFHGTATTSDLVFFSSGPEDSESLIVSNTQSSMPDVPQDIAMFDEVGNPFTDVLFGSYLDDPDGGYMHQDRVDQLFEEC